MMTKGKVAYAKFTRAYLNGFEYFAYATLMNAKVPSDIKTEKNIQYGNTKSSVLDCHYRSDNKKKPLLFYIHGGGWMTGIKLLRRPYCIDYAKEGYFVVNIEYDVAPEKQFPFQLSQIASAIDFIVEKAEEYKLDLNNVVFAGESAGAYFASYLTLLATNSDLRQRLNVPFRTCNDFKIVANVLICGAFNIDTLCFSKFPNMKIFIESYTNVAMKELRENIGKEPNLLFSPQNYIDCDYPRTVLVRAKNDSLNIETDNFVKILSDKKIENKVFSAEGIISMHGWCIASKYRPARVCLDFILNFLRKTE